MTFDPQTTAVRTTRTRNIDTERLQVRLGFLDLHVRAERNREWAETREEFNGRTREIAAIERVIAICKAHNKPCGIVVATGELARPWVEKGMRLVVAGGDALMLMQTGMRNVQAVRAVTG